MRIRELLQIEIWSKRTTRKFLVAFAILVLAVLLVEFSFEGIREHWLTPGEREAARLALAELDSLQQSGSVSKKDFSAETKRVKESVDEAERAARTRRDRLVVGDLMAYQLDIVVRRMLTERRELFKQRNVGVADAEHKLNGLMEASGANEDSDRMKLHKELD